MESLILTSLYFKNPLFITRIIWIVLIDRTIILLTINKINYYPWKWIDESDSVWDNLVTLLKIILLYNSWIAYQLIEKSTH